MNVSDTRVCLITLLLFNRITSHVYVWALCICVSRGFTHAFDDDFSPIHKRAQETTTQQPNIRTHSTHFICTNPIYCSHVPCSAGWTYLAFAMMSVTTAMLCKEQGITVTGICAVYELFVVQKVRTAYTFIYVLPNMYDISGLFLSEGKS